MTDTIEISQLPQFVPLKWIVGDALRFKATIKDPAEDFDPENPVYVVRNLTGWTAASQIRKDTKEISPIIAEFSFNVLDATGEVYGYLSPEESKKLEGVKSAKWDFQLVSPSGDPETRMAGPASPNGQVTR